jgi:phosphate transport system ATP-binding protein
VGSRDPRRGGEDVSRPLPPPVRRIALDGQPTVVAPAANGHLRAAGAGQATGGATAPPSGAVGQASPDLPAAGLARAVRQRARRTSLPATQVIERMRIESVSLAYGQRWVVREVTLPVRQGEVLALIGASGSGKTTLLRSLNRLTEVTAGASRAGSITLDGEEIDNIEATHLRRRISMVFQQPNPFPMSIFENVAYALREERRGSRRLRGRRGRRELEPAVIDALRRAGLYEEVAEDLAHPALRLSGGQQQRLCIARALAAGPEVLLLDEPCSALDPISTATIEELIVGLRESVAIVIVTHNLQQAFRVADHVAFMHLGELVEYGTSEQVFDNPRQQRTRDYIGGAFG